MSMAYNWAACSDGKPLNLEILKGTFPTRKVLKLGVFSSSSSCTDRGQGDKNAGNTCIVILYPSKFWNVFQGQRDPGAGDQPCPQRRSKTGPETSLKAHSQWALTRLGSPVLTSQVRNFCSNMVVRQMTSGPFPSPFLLSVLRVTRGRGEKYPRQWWLRGQAIELGQGTSGCTKTLSFLRSVWMIPLNFYPRFPWSPV